MKQVSFCVHPYSLLYKTFKPWFGFMALQDHLSHFEQNQMVRWSEYGIPQEKPPLLTRYKNGFVSHLTWVEPQPIISGELTEWFRDSSLNLFSPGQTTLHYIHVHEDWQIYIENCLCFIQLVMPPTSKKLMGHIGFGLCVHLSVHQELCILGFWNFWKNSWHTFCFLVRVLSLSRVTSLQKIGMKSDACHILWTMHARVLKFHIWIPHGK